MANRVTPRWLIVWKGVALCSIASTLIWSFAEPLLGHSHPEGEWTYPVRVPRSQNIYYVTPMVGMIHRVAPFVAFSIMGSFVLAALVVERRQQPPSERATLETIACAPFSALVTYLIGLCVCFVPFAAGITVRALPFLLGAWTIYWSATMVALQ
jgi:hypothetical protein